MKKYNNRFLLRTTILAILFSAVIYSLYLNLANKEQTQKVHVKDEAPNFILPKLNGDTVKLSDLKGKAVLLNFWGSWCGPCKKEMPAIQDAYDNYKNQNFEVITINIEESELTVENFFESNNLTCSIR